MDGDNPELETLEIELEFWRDFVAWWEKRHRRPAEGRILEVLADIEQRYQALRENIQRV